MKTLVLDPPPVEVAELIERRRRLGLDLYDEVWEGVYHVVPAARGGHGYLDDQLARVLGPYADRASLLATGPFNLGEPDNFRVPDHGYHRQLDPATVFFPTAAVVVEIVSPTDETYEKIPFYAAHGVDELLIVEPKERRVQLLTLAEGRYEDAERSSLLGVTMSELHSAVRWP